MGDMTEDDVEDIVGLRWLNIIMYCLVNLCWLIYTMAEPLEVDPTISKLIQLIEEEMARFVN